MLTVTANGSEKPSSSSSGVATSEKPKPVAPPMNEAARTTAPPASSCHGSSTCRYAYRNDAASTA